MSLQLRPIWVLLFTLTAVVISVYLHSYFVLSYMSTGCELVYKRKPGTATKHLASPVIKGCQPNLKNAKYYSQSQEDYALFKNYFNFPTICGGLYVEIGALDGIRYSNTKFFEETLNWTGVLIEAEPKNVKKLVKNRSRKGNVIIPEAVCPEGESYVNFSGRNAFGGVPYLMTERHVNRFYDGKLPNPIQVPCRPIGNMLKSVGVKAIDIFVVDVEGAELMVLETMDWTIPVKVFIVEMGRGDRDQRLIDLLESKGYKKSTWNIRGFCQPGKGCTNNQVFENHLFVY